jgi:hypothetical protein
MDRSRGSLGDPFRIQLISPFRPVRQRAGRSTGPLAACECPHMPASPLLYAWLANRTMPRWRTRSVAQRSPRRPSIYSLLSSIHDYFRSEYGFSEFPLQPMLAPRAYTSIWLAAFCHATTTGRWVHGPDDPLTKESLPTLRVVKPLSTYDALHRTRALGSRVPGGAPSTMDVCGDSLIQPLGRGVHCRPAFGFPFLLTASASLTAPARVFSTTRVGFVLHDTRGFC